MFLKTFKQSLEKAFAHGGLEPVKENAKFLDGINSNK